MPLASPVPRFSCGQGGHREGFLCEVLSMNDIQNEHGTFAQLQHLQHLQHLSWHSIPEWLPYVAI